MDESILIQQLSDMHAEVARYKESNNRNTKEIEGIYEKLGKLEVELAKTTTQLSEVNDRIKEISLEEKNDTHNIADITRKVDKLDIALHDVTENIKELRQETKNHIAMWQQHANDYDKEIEKSHGEETKLEATIDNIKSDVADIEESVSHMQTEFDNRLEKLEDGKKLKDGIKNFLIAILGLLATGVGIYEAAIRILK